VVSFFVACSISPIDTTASSPAHVRVCTLSTVVRIDCASLACASTFDRPERIIATPAAVAARVTAASAIPAVRAKLSRRALASSIS